jgi:transcription elongation factor SPT5
MTQVFNFDLIQKIDLKPKQWVRMKSGLYEGDLAQVVNIEDPLNKIYVRLVPRILEESTGTKKDSLGDYSKKLKKSVRPRQKLFNPQNYSDVAMKTHPILREQCYMWNKQSFKDGFVIKSVKAKSLITEDVGPKIEELRVFDLANMKNEGGSMDIENLISTLQETEISKKKKFAKGDKIKIIKGGLKGITGRIDSHADGVVRVIPDIEGLTDILEFTEDFVVKEFLPGDLVRVVMGSHIGKQGLIVKVDDDTAHIFSDSTNTEFKVSCHDIVYSTFQSNETEQNLYFQLGDLVKLNGLNTICYVIDVNKYSLKLIDTRCEIKKVSVNEVTKLTQM